MANYSATSASTPGQSFGSALMRHVQSRLPYQGVTMIQNLEELNPKYKDFFKVGSLRHEALTKQSISSSVPDEFNSPVGVGIDKNYLQYLYANVDSDKAKRMREYRVMAAFSKVADALDEICDEIINEDENGEIAVLKLKGKDFQQNVTKELNKEFQRVVQYFDFPNKGWEYFRHLLVDGELYFEHIIHKDYKKAGILGILNIPCEIIDPIYDNVQNFIIKGFILKKPEIVENKGMKRSPINTKVELIPMDRNQVTYIHSGIWNDDKTMRLPFIENARRAYRQLSLIEDSIIIYRLVRAPERLVFDVDVGNMPAPKAEAYLKKLMHQYWQKKTFDTGSGTGTINAFNPQSMLDSFWFAKRQGSEGTKVTQLPGGCLAMDTKIPLLDGRILTLSEMTEEYKNGKQNWIYSCDPSSGEIVPGKVSWAGVTQESAEVMKLTFDNGKTLICTPDHQFPIIGKGFVSANELEVNESMIPFNTQLHPINKTDKKATKYQQVYQNNTKEWQFTHKMVVNYLDQYDTIKTFDFSNEFKDCSKKQLIHHLDFWRFNNSPDNLVWMNKKDHTAYHAANTPRAILNIIKEKDLERYNYIIKNMYEKISIAAKKRCSTPEYKKKSGAIFKKMWSDPVYKQKRIAAHIQRWNIPEIADKYRQNMSLKHTTEAFKCLIDIIKDTKIVLQKDLIHFLNITPTNKFTEQFQKDNPNKNLWSGKFDLQFLKKVVRTHGYKNYPAFRREFEFFNHRIVKIEYLSSKIQVGTLTIDMEEQYHNFHTFALDCGIFTKNSNLGELSDLIYFAKELYRSLKVPTNRVDPESRNTDGSEILREELKFAKFIIRLQKAVSGSLRSMYITHLKLKGLWETYELKEDNIFIELNPPNNFYELREQQKFELKANNFNTMTSNQMISQSYAQKKYLGWRDEDIAANREWLKKDAALKFELMQTENAGPNWREHYNPEAAMGDAEPGAGGVPPGGASPLGGMPPVFGPAPKTEEGEEGAEGNTAPETGNTPPLGKPAPNQKQPGK